MKIMEIMITTAAESYGECYELGESSECEYSEEWFGDSEDPIKDYVDNMLEECVEDIENYAWDLDDSAPIYFTNYTNENGIEHILYYKGKPISLYNVVDD